MKIFTLCVLILTLVGSTMAAGKPGGNNCANVPISMTFIATTSATAAIWNDDATKAYQNGVDGVEALIILDSDCNGSRDAVMGFGKRSTRKVWMKVPGAIPGSVIQSGPASFAGGNAFLSKAHVNIRNITGYTVITPGQAATYYTMASSTFPGPDGNSYQWGSIPDDYTCPTGATCVPNLHVLPLPANYNQPEQTAWVKVTYTPRNLSQSWSNGNTDKWLVEGEFSTATDPEIQRDTLLFNGVHFGQYSMPFKILVTALAPLP